jgi:hypothetical protein
VRSAFYALLFTQGPFDYEDHLSQSPLSGTLEISLPTRAAGDSGLEEEMVPKSFLKNLNHVKFFVFDSFYISNNVSGTPLSMCSEYILIRGQPRH